MVLKAERDEFGLARLWSRQAHTEVRVMSLSNADVMISIVILILVFPEVSQTEYLTLHL